MVKASHSLGFLCKGVKSEEKVLPPALPFPLIAHIQRNGVDHQLDHYVVLHKVTKKKVLVADPAQGSAWEPWTTFRERWSGVFFVLVPEEKFERTNETRGLLERFLYLLKPHKMLLAEILISSLLLTLLGVLGAFYYRYLIDEVLYSGLPEALFALSTGFAIVLVFQSALGFARGLLVMHLANKIDAALIFEYFQHLLRLPMDFFSKRKTGEILSRLADTETIRQTISGTTMGVIFDTFMLIVGGTVLFFFSSALVGVAVVPVFLSALLVWVFAKPYKWMLMKKAMTDAEKQSHLVESINGIATIKAMAIEEHAYEKAEQRIVMSIDQGTSLGTWGMFQGTLQGFLSQAGNLAVYWLGSWFIMQGKMSLGELISFSTLLGYFLGPLGRLITLQPSLQEAMVASDRLGEILDLPDEEDQPGLMEVKELTGRVEIRDLSFSYGTRGPTLTGIDLTIEPGSRIAFVGPSGSGKTTLTKLLMKFHPAETGDILFDGCHIQDLETKSLRKKIGYVPQEILLFSGTIAENIALGQDNATTQEILQAAIEAQAHTFISKLPDRYATIVGERGSTLSGGERQRIALARVLLRKPKILILDEATSSLDSLSEAAIMQTVQSIDDKTTIVIVAHRLSTVKNCDCIYVLKDGRIIEQGPHLDLLEQAGVYAQMWQGQNGDGV